MDIEKEVRLLKENFSEEKMEAMIEDMIEEVCFRIADKYGFLFETLGNSSLSSIQIKELLSINKKLKEDGQW